MSDLTLPTRKRPRYRIPTEPELAAIFEAAAQAGIVWLMFDREAAVIDGLPVFDVEEPGTCDVERPAARLFVQVPPAGTARDFAKLMRVSVKKLQNWEQHRRNPTGPPAAVFKIVSTAPELALKSLHG